MSLVLLLLIIGVLPARPITVESGIFYRDRDTLTTVELSAFQIWQTEITRKQYFEVMKVAWDSTNAMIPVSTVSWFDAIEFCNRLSMVDSLRLTPVYRYAGYSTNPDSWPSGWNADDRNHVNIICDWTADGYRLPTEMEWMFAAMGGKHTEGYRYSGSSDINSVAWYGGNSHQRAREVALKRSNKLELYDMSGNIWEWCWDIHRAYEKGDYKDPRGPEKGSYRVLRGGSWLTPGITCSVSHRFCFAPTTKKNYIGFRIARTISRD